MKVVSPLTAIVSKAEYDQGVGQDFHNLYVVDEAYNYFHRSKLAEGGHCLLSVKELPKVVVEGTEKTAEQINFLPGGKIPFMFLSQIVSFFKKVMQVNFSGSSTVGQDCEAMAHILWNKEGKYYEIGIPVQKVGKASVTYEHTHYNPEKHVVIVDIHSHNTMGAFFSGTDDSDDKKGVWFAGVAGQLNRDTVALKFRFTNFGIFRDVSINDIFEEDPITEGKLVIDLENVNQEWMDKVQGHYVGTTYSSQNYGGGWNRQGNGNAGERSGHDDSRLAALYSGYGDDDYQWFGEFGGFLGHMHPDYHDDRSRGSRSHQGSNVRSFPPRGAGGRFLPRGGRAQQGRNVNPRVNVADDFYLRSQQDAIEGIQDLDFPVCRTHFVAVMEALVGRVEAGIKERQSSVRSASFMLELAEIAAEKFNELHTADEVNTYLIPHICGELIQHTGFERLTEIFKGILLRMETGFKGDSHIDLLIEALEENVMILDEDHLKKLRDLTNQC